MSPLADATVRTQAAPDAAPLAAPGGVPEAIQAQAQPELPPTLAPVVAGEVPALPIPPVQPDQPLLPEQEFIIQNYEALPELNLGLYEAQDATTILFNAAVLDESLIQQAEQEGRLPELLSATGGQPSAPAPGPGDAAGVAQTRAEQRPSMPVQTAPAVPSMPAPKMPAGTANLLAKTRIRNMGAGPKPPGITPAPLSNAVARRPV